MEGERLCSQIGSPEERTPVNRSTKSIRRSVDRSIMVVTKFAHPRCRSVSVMTMAVLALVFVAAALAQQDAGGDDDTCPIDSTPSDMLGPFYVEGSPSTTQIGPSDLLQDPATRLSVSGRVLSLLDQQEEVENSSSCGVGIPNVTVEVWYAGPPDSQGNYYRNDAFRGQMNTDECGRYSFVQVFPAQYPTRPILHDHFRLSAEGTELLVTQLYFLLDDDDNGTNRTADASGQAVSPDGYVTADDAYPLQAQPVQQNSDGSRSVRFDLYLDNVRTGTVSTQSVSSATSSSTGSLCPAVAGSSSSNNNNQTGTTSGQLSNSSETSADGSADGSSSGSYPAALSTAAASVAALLLSAGPW